LRAVRGRLVALACALLLGGPGAALASPGETSRSLQALAAEREILTAELEQYQQTIETLQDDDTPPEESSNPAVRKLAVEVVELKERLIVIAEQEVTLLQKQITEARTLEEKVTAEVEREREEEVRVAIESKPLRDTYRDYSIDIEAENVERLHQLLENYHADVQQSSITLPTEEELRARELALRDAETLARIPFSASKVRLSGAEGNTALSQISQRLMDPRIPESRRDISPIVVIKTRLYGALVGSENRSLKPVGKNHYVARVRLQPGDTTLSILDNRWDVRLPQHTEGKDFLVTFYRPPRGTPELHVFAIDDMLAEDRPYIPAWLPKELKIRTGTG